jgi:hypothetical protein
MTGEQNNCSHPLAGSMPGHRSMEALIGYAVSMPGRGERHLAA